MTTTHTTATMTVYLLANDSHGSLSCPLHAEVTTRTPAKNAFHKTAGALHLGGKRGRGEYQPLGIWEKKKFKKE